MKFDNIIIGFGKGGKTLAKKLSEKKQSVLLIEQSNKMYGGTCINVGCIPSKSLIKSASKKISFVEAVKEKNELVKKLREKNFRMIDDEETAKVINGTAKFLSNYTIEIKKSNGDIQVVEGEHIFINTGSKPVVLPIKGLNDSSHVVDSTGIMNLEKLPEKLVIIGAGYIGLEFASMFKDFGSEVTILDSMDKFLPREDEDIASLIYKDLVEKGIAIHLGVAIDEIKDSQGNVYIKYRENDSKKVISASNILIATGRKANTDNLGLDSTDISIDDRGNIVVDDYLKTSVRNIWALGDVKGGLQFTYISLDDYRIIIDQLFGDGKRTTRNRANVPYSVFIDPPLSNVELTETEARNKNIDFKIYKQEFAKLPKALVLNRFKGIIKILVNNDNKKIIGASIYGVESHEVINLITLAMNADLPYTILRDQIFTHPTISEVLNDVLK
ncbi:FAD-dependent oxidoreductase [Enterococcus faecalis]|uniref:FAD-dependent oxidoreductase n=1 Tax=Enterococcus faecalis TaxID=1351 RepID=UPI001E55C1E6|nr:FAD-dependent oxidoreductase [Enterococcus faecalis]MCD4894014.1 FAD-dependent oxidoreductase [Enterococcus faecalis]